MVFAKQHLDVVKLFSWTLQQGLAAKEIKIFKIHPVALGRIVWIVDLPELRPDIATEVAILNDWHNVYVAWLQYVRHVNAFRLNFDTVQTTDENVGLASEVKLQKFEIFLIADPAIKIRVNLIEQGP